jgi:hypothetical protein
VLEEAGALAAQVAPPGGVPGSGQGRVVARRQLQPGLGAAGGARPGGEVVEGLLVARIGLEHLPPGLQGLGLAARRGEGVGPRAQVLELVGRGNVHGVHRREVVGRRGGVALLQRPGGQRAPRPP